jgi:hypothetical protein
VRVTNRTEDEAKRASSNRLFKAGWYDARITEAVEKLSRAGNDCIELTVAVGEKSLRDWLSDADRGAAKLRHCCEAVDALEKFEAGEIGQDDFPGHDVQVKIEVEKRRGFPDQNRITDYRSASASSVVNLRVASGPDGRG